MLKYAVRANIALVFIVFLQIFLVFSAMENAHVIIPALDHQFQISKKYTINEIHASSTR